MKKARLILMVTLLATLCIFVFASSASAHTAYRYWTAGTGGEALGTHDSNYALSWIQGKAKGSYSDDGGYRLWVVLADRKINHHDTNNNRPGQYWNMNDPYYYTNSIQYTLWYAGYAAPGFSIDNIYGAGTQMEVWGFQDIRSELEPDGVVGTNTYYVMSYCGTGPYGAR